MKLKLGDVLNLNHVENFEIIKNEKIKEYGKETDDGNIGISDTDTESLKKFQNDLNPLINSDVTLEIDKIKAEEIFDKGIPAEYLLSLYPFIEE